MPILGATANGAIRGFGRGAATSISASSFESIATVSVDSGGASNVEFTSIPGTYKHLQIRGISRNTGGGSDDDGILLTFNSDTGSNYANHILKGNGTSATAGAGASATSISTGLGARDAATAGIYGAFVADILDYANTNKYKTLRSLNGVEFNTSNGVISLKSGLWQSNSAVTSIKLVPENANFKQYSHFALYGIKGA